MTNPPLGIVYLIPLAILALAAVLGIGLLFIHTERPR